MEYAFDLKGLQEEYGANGEPDDLDDKDLNRQLLVNQYAILALLSKDNDYRRQEIQPMLEATMNCIEAIN